MTNIQSMRVVTSCRGRFHIFDQARELARHDALYQLITDYPKAWTTRHGVPADKVRSLLLSGFINHGLGRVRAYIPAAYQTGMDRWVHDRFSRQLAGLIPDETQYFIGLSSFCYEALKICREREIPCAVDHGSLHQKEEALLVQEEAARYGISTKIAAAPDWVIEKEDKEFHLANHVFALSGAAKESMVRQGIPPEKIVINHCGVNLNSFCPGIKKDNTFRVIQVGSISIRKGIATLLDAYARAKLPDSELCFVGDAAEAGGFQTTIDALRTKGVVFHAPVPQAKLREYYNQSSVFVLASVADGFGLVVPQAMACGLPVIVTENVGAKDLVVNGVNGFIVPVGAPEIIADRLRQLRDDPELCRAMGDAARATVEKGYTWQGYGERLVSFLRTQVSR